MIKAKSEDWNEVSEETKREMFRIYHVFNTYWEMFNASTFNSWDNCVELKNDAGYVWTYSWENPSEAPESAVNGVLEFPAFTDAHYELDYYKQEAEHMEQVDRARRLRLLEDCKIKNGELIDLTEEN